MERLSYFGKIHRSLSIKLVGGSLSKKEANELCDLIRYRIYPKEEKKEYITLNGHKYERID